MSLLPLRPGARIGIVGPAGIHDPQSLAHGCDRVRGWGFEPVPGPHLGARHRYMAGTDAERLHDLRWALTAPDLDAVWLARGGYGITRLLPLLPGEEVAPRPVLGFSDATALLWSLWRRGVPGAVHAPVLNSLAHLPDAASLEALRRLLQEGRGGEWRVDIRIPGSATGPLVGGNLCTLASLAGTAEGFRAPGAILLLEEVGEAPYRVDRLLTQLRDSGGLDGIRAVAMGDFQDCSAPAGAGWDVLDVVEDAVRPLGIPLVTGVPVGHGARNHPFVLGAPAVLSGGTLSWSLG